MHIQLVQKKKYYIDKIKKKTYTIYSRKVYSMREKNKTLLKIAGIINILEGTLFCINNYVTVVGLIIIALGVLLINIGNKSTEEQMENKVLLLILAIVQVGINLISAILLFIVWDSLSNYQKHLNGTDSIENAKIEISFTEKSTTEASVRTVFSEEFTS